MTQTPHIGALVHYFNTGSGTPLAAVVTSVSKRDRGEFIVPEHRIVTEAVLTVFFADATVPGVKATFGELFDPVMEESRHSIGRAYWPTFE